MAQDNTAAERQRRRRERLKEEGMESTTIPLDKEGKNLLDRLLERRGYQPRQMNRQIGAGKVIREALTLLDKQDQLAEEREPEAETPERVKMDPRSGGGYEVTVSGTYVGILYRGTFRGKRGWEGETPKGEKVGGQTMPSATRRLAQAVGVPYPD